MEYLGNNDSIPSGRELVYSLEDEKENQAVNEIDLLAQETLLYFSGRESPVHFMREAKKSTDALSLSHSQEIHFLSQEILLSASNEISEEQDVELFDLNPYFSQIREVLNSARGKFIDSEKNGSLLVVKLENRTEKRILDSLIRYLEVGGPLVFIVNEDSRNALLQHFSTMNTPVSEEVFTRLGFLSKRGDHLVLFNMKSEQVKLEFQINEEDSADFFYVDASKQEQISFYREIASPILLNTEGIEQKNRVLQEFFQAIVDKASLHPHLPLFENFSCYLSLAQNRLASRRLLEETLQIYGGREEINRCLQEMDGSNGPVRYEAEQIDAYITAYQKLKNLPEVKEKVLDYASLLIINEKFKEILYREGVENVSSLGNNFGMPETSFESLMREALDKMEIKERSIVRVLEPGNNDQSTPLFVAHQINFILEYAKEKNLHVNVQVLVMGLGGHATTAVFPQIGELKEGQFYGTPEAVSLGTTLREALLERGIEVSIVEKFEKDVFGRVQIKLAKNSKNTGENVTEAVKCDENEAERPPHLFVAAARPSSLRQTLTFAQQYSENKQNPLAKKLYQSITSIPFSRSLNFIKNGLTDFQAVTEMYMGLAEECRLFLYGFGAETDYIPASPIEITRLDRLYSAYDRLSGTNHLDISKNRTIKELIAFFGERAIVMEKAIDWSPEVERQQVATKNVAARTVKRMKRKESFLKTHANFCEWQKNPEALNLEEKRLFNMCGELLAKARAAKNDQEKMRYYLAIGALSKKIV